MSSNKRTPASSSRNGGMLAPGPSTSPSATSSPSSTRPRAPSLAPSLTSLSAPRMSTSSPSHTTADARLTASPHTPSMLARSPDGSAATRLRRVASGASLRLGKRVSMLTSALAAEEEEEGEGSSISSTQAAQPVDVPTPTATAGASGESLALKRTLSPHASPPTSEGKARGAARRRTWWGLGAEEVEVAAPSPSSGQQSDVVQGQMGGKDEPPPPMNDDEAAFRAALMRDTGAQLGTSSSSSAAAATATAEPTAASATTEQDLKAPPALTQQEVAQARRASWFSWRGGASEEQHSQPEATSASAPVTAAPSVIESTPVEAAQPDPTPSAAPTAPPQPPASATARRTWFARNASLDVPSSSSNAAHANHAHSPLRQTWRASQASSASSDVAPTTDSAEEIKVKGQMQPQAQAQVQGGATVGASAPQQPQQAQQQQQQGSWSWGYWPLSSAPAKAAGAVEATPSASAAGESSQDTQMRDASPPPSTAPSGVKAQALAYSQEALGLVNKWSPVPLPAWVVSPSSSNDAATAASSQGERGGESKSALSPAEQVKADALARPSPPPSTKTMPEVEARTAMLNPATKSGWIAYFSSKSAKVATQHIAPRPEGPEEMDVDVEPSGGAQASSSAAAGGGAGAGAGVSAVVAAPSKNGAKESTSNGTGAGNGNGGNKSIVHPAKSASVNVGGGVKTIVARTLVPKGSHASLKPASPLLPPSPSVASVRSVPANTIAAAAAGATEKPPTTADAVKHDPSPISTDPSAPMTRGGAGGTTDAVVGAPSSSKLKSNKGPNLILPSFDDTFTRAPRAYAPRAGVLGRTLSAVSKWYSGAKAEPSAAGGASGGKGGKLRQSSSIISRGPGLGNRKSEATEAENRLPRTWDVMGLTEKARLKGTRVGEKVVVIGLHGWFSQGPLAKVFGEPTGTSTKLATMMSDAVKRHYERAGVEAPSGDNLTLIPLQGDGKVADRVDRHYAMLLADAKWVAAVKSADVLLVSAHSQGCVVATHLLARLLEQGLVVPAQTRVALLAVAGINHGPFNSLRSGVSQYYLNAFESPAAKELFEFQSSSSAASQQYAAAQRIVLRAGVKVAYVASVDDQVVGIYSALNSSISHPSILRALFCDGQQFARVDFLTNLLAFCVAVMNAGLPDHGLLTLLSASVAGSLYAGAGHSRVYEEPATYDLAVRYLYETTSPLRAPTTLSDGLMPSPTLEAFEPQRWNPYSLPWALRGLLEDAAVRELYADDISELLDAFARWTPATKTLKDVQWRLEPMRMIPRPQTQTQGKDEREVDRSAASSVSKL